MENVLDVIDKEIMLELEENSRQSIAALARRIRRKKAQVAYRLERMQKRNVITGYQYITNQILLGKMSFGIFLLFDGAVQEDLLLEKIAKVEGVSWSTPILGNWDALIVVIKEDLLSFLAVLQRIFSLCGHHVKMYSFYADYEGYITNHKYLYEHPRKISSHYGPGNHVELTKNEQDVYTVLKKEPLLSLLDAAFKLGKTYDTMKACQLRLMQKRVLLRCRPRINIAVLGYREFLFLLQLRPFEERKKALLRFCLSHPLIMRYTHCLGHFDCMLTVHGKNEEDIKQVTYQLRKEFGDLLVHYEVLAHPAKAVPSLNPSP